jgi:acyl carrier protein
MSEVATKVHEIISAQLGVNSSEIKDSLYLQDDLNADPLDIADVVVSLEEEYKIVISQEDSLKFKTVGEIVTYVSEHLNEL